MVRFPHDASLGYTTVAEIPRNLILSHCIVNGQVGFGTDPMSNEAAAFMYMQLAGEEMGGN
ncbi:MAG: hypothetical protein HKM89_00090 [Gemmatimonadales bacterium]|nr:hypothetical protein [Gemmatimonadales bacterium]